MAGNSVWEPKTLWRVRLGLFIGGSTWIAVAVLGLIALRIAWPDYERAERNAGYTQSMLIARLVVSSAAALAAGWIGCLSVRERQVTPIYICLLPLIVFWRLHVDQGVSFPAWYYIAFLVTLPLFVFIGSARA